jgi:transcriptional regulator with XRE-family HTH domain
MTRPDSDKNRAHLGSRLRTLRVARALSLTNLSRASGLTKGYLSKVEREIASPSTSALVLICDKLEISLGTLFSTTTHHNVIRANERIPISLGGEGVSEALLTPPGERRVQVLHTVIEAGGGSGPEQYSLPSDVEFALVVSGAISLNVEGVVHHLGEGDSITFSSQTPHSFRNEHPTREATILWVFSPALPNDFR